MTFNSEKSSFQEEKSPVFAAKRRLNPLKTKSAKKRSFNGQAIR